MIEIKKDLRWCWHCNMLIAEEDVNTHLDANPTHFICEGVGTAVSAGGVELNPFKAQDFEVSGMPTGTHNHELATQAGLGWKRYGGEIKFLQRLKTIPFSIRFSNVRYTGPSANLRMIRSSLNKRGFRFQVYVLNIVPGAKGEIAPVMGQTTGVSFDWEAIA